MKIIIILGLYLKKLKKSSIYKKKTFELKTINLILYFFLIFYFLNFVAYLYKICFSNNHYFCFSYFLIYFIFIKKLQSLSFWIKKIVIKIKLYIFFFYFNNFNLFKYLYNKVIYKFFNSFKLFLFFNYLKINR